MALQDFSNRLSTSVVKSQARELHPGRRDRGFRGAIPSSADLISLSHVLGQYPHPPSDGLNGLDPLAKQGVKDSHLPVALRVT